MKVALITDGIYPYVLGGMQRHSYFIAKYLTRHKVYVDLYHTWANKEYDIQKLEYFTEEEKKYIRHFVVDFPKTGVLPGHYLRRSYEYSKRVFDIFSKNAEVDFVYIKGFAGWKLIEEKAKGMKLPPLGIKFHGLNMFQKAPNIRAKIGTWMFRPPVKYNLEHADFVFSYGGKITDITRRAGVPENKIIDIPTGIDTDWLKVPVRSGVKIRRFVFIGRYERLKGIVELNLAIKQLLKDKIKFEFHFVGPIPEKVKIRNAGVIYHDTITDAEKIKAVLDGMDCLVCPSYSEGMPNVIIEAMSRGLAIIATDVGAVNVMVSKENGVLLRACSVKEIKLAMGEIVLKSENDLFRYKEASYNFTKQHLIWDKIADVLVEKIKNRISGHHL